MPVVSDLVTTVVLNTEIKEKLTTKYLTFVD